MNDIFNRELVDQLTQLQRQSDDRVAKAAARAVIKGQARAESTNRLMIDGYISEMISDEVNLFLENADGDIEVCINSMGGASFIGMAIANRLAAYDKGKVTTIVDGAAASAASMIFQGGHNRVMRAGTRLMIHDTSILAYGNAEFMLKTAALLDKLSQDYAEYYAMRGGLSATEYRAAMLEETWYSADEAIAAGLADEKMEVQSKDDDTHSEKAAKPMSNCERLQAAALMLQFNKF